MAIGLGFNPLASPRRSPFHPSSPSHSHKRPTPPPLSLAPPPPSTTTNLKNRFYLCLISITLTWLSSLQLATSISSNYISPPALSTVIETCNNAYEVTLEEKSSYEKCIDRQSSSCTTSLTDTNNREFNRVVDAAAYNKATIDNQNNLTESCTQAYTDTMLSVQTWLHSNIELTFPYITTLSSEVQCPLSKRAILDKIHSSSITATRSEVFMLTTDYSSSSISTVDNLAEYIKLRSAYDAAYIANRTISLDVGHKEWLGGVKPLPALSLDITFDLISLDVNSLISCVSVRSPDSYSDELSCPNISAYDLLTYINHRTFTLLNTTRLSLQKYADITTDFRADAAKTYNNMKSFYNGVMNAVQASSIDVRSWGSFMNLELVDFQVPNRLCVNCGVPDIDVLGDLDVDYVWDEVSVAFDGFTTDFTDIKTHTEEMIKLWIAKVYDVIGDGPNIIPDDYNPPKYRSVNGTEVTVESEQQRHRQDSVGFVERSGSILGTLGDLNSGIDDDVSDSKPFSFFNSSLMKRSNLEFSSESLKAPKIDMALWIFSLANLSNLFLYFDIAYRLLTTLRMLYMFWGRSSVNVPDVDITADHASEIKLLSTSSHKMFRVIITNPYVPNVLFGCVMFWAVFIVSSLYTPLYADYQRGCIRGNVNGSFVTSNLYSMAYNYASSDGNAEAVENLSIYDESRTGFCSASGASTADSSNADDLSYKQSQFRHVNAADGIDVYAACLDYDRLDRAYDDACCGVSGRGVLGDVYSSCDGMEEVDSLGVRFTCPTEGDIPFPLISKVLFNDACMSVNDYSNVTLKQAAYNCDFLPTCEMTCTGPSKPKIKQVTTECGCYIEWKFHTSWMQFALGVLIYVLMNVSQINLIRGLCRIFYKELHPGLFTFKGTCNRSGELIVCNTAGVEDKNMREFKRAQRDSTVTTIYWDDEEVCHGDNTSQRTLEDSREEFEEDVMERQEVQGLLEGELDGLLVSYRRNGFVRVFGAVVINLVWVYAVVNLTSNVNYEG